MGYRGRDARPRLALWTLVVLGNVVLLVAAAGVAVLATLLSLVTLAGAALAGWHLTRRGSVTRRGGMSVPVALASRRRA
ncbi:MULTISPECIES: hypothetical protein [Micromonospora]|uniref:Uncharacterized protein n=2 Tax=Micromonospora TaxID=1873 RepID=A0A9X0I7F0_9ACTN|nr:MULTISPECIES: hypothetical protein [Micromonospora]KUJ48297.1 hypothetical protein ADL17_04355 [Micromonospora maris]PMR57932.1 hypothetical protein C1A38_27270 [Verrucosispora sp. ts21]RUL92697.1 hypothetical protein EG812_14900 [Verrucosispora sp. FIM060022]GIJ13990.1 hypothetical protein Vgi01_06740 [Micromonospora gifhornensis]